MLATENISPIVAALRCRSRTAKTRKIEKIMVVKKLLVATNIIIGRMIGCPTTKRRPSAISVRILWRVAASVSGSSSTRRIADMNSADATKLAASSAIA